MRTEKDYIGYWVKENNDDENSLDMLNVVSVDLNEGLAYAVNKNIPIHKLVSEYTKKDINEMTDNPFNMGGGAIPKDLISDDVQETKENQNNTQSEVQPKVQNEDLGNIQPKPQKQEVVVGGYDEEMEFINRAIGLSKETVELSVSVNVVLPFDIKKIIGSMDSFGISKEKVSKVILDHLKTPRVTEQVIENIVEATIENDNGFEVLRVPDENKDEQTEKE